MLPPAAQIALHIQGLSKRRGARTLFSGLELLVREGELLALAGLNGAGKTTLIKCLLDLDMLDAGQIAIFGRRHTQAAARARLAYLPENFRPPEQLNGREFLAFMCRLHGNPPGLERLEQVLTILDLEPAALEQRGGLLSKGSAQKLGLAACLLSGKTLLILDEPMSGLDLRARAGLREYLLELKRQGGACLFATHLLADAERICDRVSILHQGKICFSGAPEGCCRRYQASGLEQAFLRCLQDD